MDDILGSIYSLLIALVGSLYELVSKAFELFYVLSEASTIEKSVYENVVKNFYLIIGIVMLFTIAFSLLKSMVSSDDDKGTANAGKIVTNFVTSIIILLILPTIFSFAFSFQTAVVNQNTIGRIFGMNATENSGNSIASAGNEMANSVFTAFFTPSDDFCNENTEEGKECSELLKNDDKTTLYEAIGSVNKNGWFGIYSSFGNQVADGVISFNFFVLLIAGLFLLYVVASFCLDLGVRLVKLVFYQIIAPIPVFMRVVPDGKLSNTFNEWTKITITCYIEVFLRLFIIYFGVFLVSAFLNDKGLGTLFSNLNGGIGLIAKAILVLSIVVFIKQAPKLIGDLFGIDSSNMKLGIMDKLAAGGMLAAGAATGGAITSAVRGFTGSKKHGIRRVGSALGSGISGAGRGLKSGMGAKNFTEMKQAASKAASDVETKRQERELYSASKGGHVIKGRAEDALGTVKTWAGLNKIDEGEANRYDAAANAIDAAHGVAEGVYKNKPDHNKLKEEVSALKSEVSRREQKLAAAGIDSKELENFETLWSHRNDRDLKENERRYLSDLQSQISGIDADFISVLNQRDEAEVRKSIHEASEMKKKLSVQMTAVNKLVEAKIKYADIAGEIVTDDVYEKLKPVDGGNIDALINKIKNNDLILVEDLKDVDLNSLEKFLDQAGINAKNIAANKNAAVAHEKALQDDKSSDNK